MVPPGQQRESVQDPTSPSERETTIGPGAQLGSMLHGGERSGISSQVMASETRVRLGTTPESGQGHTQRCDRRCDEICRGATVNANRLAKGEKSDLTCDSSFPFPVLASGSMASSASSVRACSPP